MVKAFGEEFPIDLGRDHWLRWHSGDHPGASVYHKAPSGEDCLSGFNLLPGGWKMEQAYPLTISPSLLCSCGDHGFIRDGKWVPA